MLSLLLVYKLENQFNWKQFVHFSSLSRAYSFPSLLLHCTAIFRNFSIQIDGIYLDCYVTHELGRTTDVFLEIYDFPKKYSFTISLSSISNGVRFKLTECQWCKLARERVWKENEREQMVKSVTTIEWCSHSFNKPIVDTPTTTTKKMAAFQTLHSQPESTGFFDHLVCICLWFTPIYSKAHTNTQTTW